MGLFTHDGPGREARGGVRMDQGFTLIELLIVVAIIAVLAAIAVPNFLEAQTRSKVSRAKNDMRTQAVALDSYYVDWNAYTRDSDSSLDTDAAQVSAIPEYTYRANGATQLTTPIAYMSSLLADPFAVGGKVMASGGAANGYRIASGSWSYDPSHAPAVDSQQAAQVMDQMGPRPCYAVISPGPDQVRARMGYKCFPFMPASDSTESPVTPALDAKGAPHCWLTYDPSNGTVSKGDIYTFGGSWRDGRFMLDGVTIGGQTSPGGATW